jgi:hypothetical protein
MGFWPIVLNVLRNSDVILLVTDARIPEFSRNTEIITKAENMKKRLIPVFNKTDLIKSSQIKKLKKEYPNAFFISALKKIGIKKLKETLFNIADNFEKNTLRIGIVGYPNTGKSTIINLLAPQARAKVSSVSGTTKKTQWIRVKNLRIMDSPGVIPFSDKKVQIGLTASKDPNKIRNPEKIAIKIIEFLNEKNSSILENFYNIKTDKSEKIFEKIARKKGYLVKGGNIDENRTAIKIIDDWQKGKIKIK